MTAHTRTASLAPSFLPTTARTSTNRLVLVTAGVLLQTVFVLGFVASTLGVGGAAYPDPGSGRLAPSTAAPVAPAVEAAPATSGALGPQPAPAPAP